MVPKHVITVLSDFSRAADLPEFYLIGGAALDTQLNPSAPIKDWDICVHRGPNQQHILNALAASGFSNGSPRVYRLNHRFSCLNVESISASLGTFDIAFIDDPDAIQGPFNLDSLMIKFPEMRIIDNFDAVASLLKGELRIVRRPIEFENPIILVKRLIAFVGKHGSRILDNEESQTTVMEIKMLFETACTEHQKTYGLHDRAGCFSRLLNSIVRSKDSLFLPKLLRTNLLDLVFPDLPTILSSDSFLSAVRHHSFQSSKEVLAFIVQNSKPSEARIYIDLLRMRAWDSTWSV